VTNRKEKGISFEEKGKKKKKKGKRQILLYKKRW